MIRAGFLWGTLLAGFALVTYVGCSSGAKEASSEACVSPEAVADYLHAVIEADRTLYASLVVERMQHHGKVVASQDWERKDALPLPAQMLQLAGLEVEEQGTGLKYRLASLWPLEKANGPTTHFERTGLQAVSDDPREVPVRTLQRAKYPYFKAIYADRAVSIACVTCHNQHPRSLRRNYKLNDVMGGVIISFPLK